MSKEKEMTLIEHIEELRGRVLRGIAAVVVVAVFTFTFGIRQFDISGVRIYLPFPEMFRNISALVIEKIKDDMLPSNVKLLQSSPGQVVYAEILVSIFIGILFGMPVIAHQIGSFVAPGLYERERKMIVKAILPVTLLFAAGAVFSYVFVTPAAFQILYAFGLELDVTQFITIPELIEWVVLLAVALGIAFQLPVVMYTLSNVGIVEPDFWKRNFRYSLFLIVLFGAIVTPDTSGITMWFVALPMTVLYGAGYLFASRRVKQKPTKG